VQSQRRSPDLSPYAIGRFGWVLPLAFFSLAIASLSAIAAVCSQVKSIVGYIGLVLLLIVATGTTIGGMFPSDPITTALDELSENGELHILGATIAIPAMPLTVALLSQFSLTRCLMRDPPVRRQTKLERSETISPWKWPLSLRPRKFMTSLAPKHSVLWLSNFGYSSQRCWRLLNRISVEYSFRSLNRRHEWAAFSSHRATVFQAICFTRAMADLFRPSTLSSATSSKVERRCWSR
jgi:hypothetical protein